MSLNVGWNLDQIRTSQKRVCSVHGAYVVYMGGGERLSPDARGTERPGEHRGRSEGGVLMNNAGSLYMAAFAAIRRLARDTSRSENDRAADLQCLLDQVEALLEELNDPKDYTGPRGPIENQAMGYK